MISFESVRKLRPVGYLTAAILAVTPTIDLAIASWPLQFSQAPWRNTFMTVFVPTTQSLLLAFFVWFAVSILTEDRVGTLINASFAGTIAVLLVALLPLVALDWIQLRPQVNPQLAKRFDVVNIWMMARMLADIIAFGLMSFAGVRLAKRHEQRAPTGSELLVGGVKLPGRGSEAPRPTPAGTPAD